MQLIVFSHIQSPDSWPAEGETILKHGLTLQKVEPRASVKDVCRARQPGTIRSLWEEFGCVWPDADPLQFWQAVHGDFCG